MKNTLNEILSMMSKIDSGYVSEDGNGASVEDMDIMGIPVLRLAKMPYNDNVHFPIVVSYIDSIYSNFSANKENLKVLNSTEMAKDTLGWVLERVTLMLYGFNEQIGKLIKENINSSVIEKELTVPGSFSVNLKDYDNIFDEIGILVLHLINYPDDANSENLKKQFIQNASYMTGINMDENGVGELSYFFRKAVNLSTVLRNEIEKDSEITTSNDRIVSFIGEKITKLCGEISDEIRNSGNFESDDEENYFANKMLSNKISTGKYEYPTLKNLERGAYTYSNSDDYKTLLNLRRQQNPGKSKAVGVTRPTIRATFGGNIYGRVRSYLYYSANKDYYSNKLRSYMFGDRCFVAGKDNTTINYEEAKWDDPLYGDNHNDETYTKSSTISTISDILFNRVGSDIENERVSLFEDTVKDLFGTMMPIAATNDEKIDSPEYTGKLMGSKKPSTLYECAETMLQRIKVKNDLAANTSTLETNDGDFSRLSGVFELLFLRNKVKNSYLNLLTFNDIVNDIPVVELLNRAKENGFEITGSIPSGGLNIISRDGSVRPCGVIEYFRRSVTRDLIEESTTGSKVCAFCNEISNEYANKYLIGNKGQINEDVNLSNFDPLVTTIYKTIREYMEWKEELNRSLRKKGSVKDEEIFGLVGNLSFDVYNKASKTLIEYQGEQHFHAESVASPIGIKIREEEYTDKTKFRGNDGIKRTRLEVYNIRREMFFNFVKSNHMKFKSMYVLCDAFLKTIIDGVDSKRGVDEFGVPFFYYNERVTGKGDSMLPKVNSPFRWEKEIHSWKKISDSTKTLSNRVAYENYYGKNGVNFYALNLNDKIVVGDFNREESLQNGCLYQFPWEPGGTNKELKNTIFDIFNNTILKYLKINGTH